MLATELRATNFTGERSETTATRRTIASWINHFFGMMPEEVIDRACEAVCSVGVEPDQEEFGTDDFVYFLPPEKLAEIWYTRVLPAVGMRKPEMESVKGAGRHARWWRVVLYENGVVTRYVRQPFGTRLQALAACARINGRGLRSGNASVQEHLATHQLSSASYGCRLECQSHHHNNVDGVVQLY